MSQAVQSKEKNTASQMGWYTKKPLRNRSCPYNQTQLLYCKPGDDRYHPDSKESLTTTHFNDYTVVSSGPNTTQIPEVVHPNLAIVIPISLSALAIIAIIIFDVARWVVQRYTIKSQSESFNRELNLSSCQVERPLPDPPNESTETDTTYYSIISDSTDQEATDVSVINSASSAAVHPGTYVDGAKLADIEKLDTREHNMAGYCFHI